MITYYLLSRDRYHNGNDDDAGQGRGFGHTGFLVDDLNGACEWLESEGIPFRKKPQDGNMKSKNIFSLI